MNSTPAPPPKAECSDSSPLPDGALHALSRRRFVGGAAAAGALMSAGWPAQATAFGRDRTPRGLGSVSGAPGLPARFEQLFTSRLVDIGDVRLHAVTGGEGPPLLLVHGWPQTWYAWRLVMPALADRYHVIAVDQRGIGLSDKTLDGYDSTTLARDIVALMDALGHERFFIYGTDVGMPIAYAVAADYPNRVARLVVSEAFLPGIGDGPLLLQRNQVVNARLWHLAFNQLPADVNEALVAGREEIFFGAEFDASAGTHKLDDDTVRYYVRMLRSGRRTLHGSFGFYRALWTTADQNIARRTRKLAVPVLAIGGGESSGSTVGATMMVVANNVQTLVIPGAGHWIAEQAPEQIVAALTSFLTG